MYDEMLEQPLSIKQTLKHEKTHMVDVAEKFQDFDHIYLVGCGSSLSSNYSARDAYNFLSDQIIDVNTGYEFYFQKKLDTKNSGAIFTSQSGETTDTIAALKKAKENGLYTVCITNEENSSISDMADDSILTRCGTERAIVGTKTYLTQLLSLYEILFNMDDSRLTKAVLNDIHKIPSTIDHLIQSTEEQNRILAKQYKDYEIFYSMGTGPNYGLTYKFAMTMLMEGAVKHACPIYSGEFRHGLIERVEEDVPIVYLDADYPGDELTKKSIDFCTKLGVNNIQFKMENYSNLNPLLSPFILVIPLEWFTYYLAHYNEKDPSSTRHIGKVRY